LSPDKLKKTVLNELSPNIYEIQKHLQSVLDSLKDTGDKVDKVSVKKNLEKIIADLNEKRRNIG